LVLLEQNKARGRRYSPVARDLLCRRPAKSRPLTVGQVLASSSQETASSRIRVCPERSAGERLSTAIPRLAHRLRVPGSPLGWLGSGAALDRDGRFVGGDLAIFTRHFVLGLRSSPIAGVDRRRPEPASSMQLCPDFIE
jgi:hypothetical protein